MKKINYLLGLLVVFSVLVFGCTRASTTEKVVAKDAAKSMEGQEAMMSEEGFEMKDGKMIMVNEKTKAMSAMEKDMTLNDGTKVMTTGKVIRKDGATFMLKEGESIWMDGSFLKAGEMMKENMMESHVNIIINAQSNSGENGKATIKDEDGKAEVYIELSTYPSNPQPAHIHFGSCNNLGDVKYPLSNVVNGKSETKLDVSTKNLLSQLPLAVNVHKSAGEIKVYVACGDIKNPEAMMQSEYKGKVLAGTTSKYIEFNKADYDMALKENKKILLYFYANWCQICKKEQPETFAAFNELNDANLIGFRVNFRDSDTDADEVALAKQFGIAYQHTKVILKNGQQVGKWPDSWNKQRYLDEIAKV